MKKIPDWLILCVWRALLGEIYPEVRAIAVSISQDACLTIRYYLDREPQDYDWESLEVVATNISSSVSAEKIFRICIECLPSESPIGSLESLDGFIYCRREYD